MRRTGALLAVALLVAHVGVRAGSSPAVADPPGPAAVALARVDSLLAAGATGQAAVLGLWAVARWGDDPLYGGQVQGRTGAALRLAGRPVEALVHLEQAVGLRPEDAGLRHELGLTLAELGRIGRALAEFEQAAVLDPVDPAPHLEAGRLRGALGDWQGARVELAAGRKLCGDCPEADRLLASVLMAAGRPAEAIEPLQRLWAAQPDSQLRHHLLGALAGAGRDSATLALVGATPARDRTRDDWRMAVRAEGRVGGARWSAASLAVADTSAPARFPGDDAVFWGQASLNLLAAGRASEALQAVDRALALDAGQAVLYHNRAAILAALGRPDEARRSLDTARSLGPHPDQEERH